MVSPQISVYPEPQDVILHGNRVLADILKVRIRMRWHWIRIVVRKIRVSFSKTGEDPQRHRVGRVKMAAKTAVMWPQSKEHLDHQHWEEAGKNSPLEPWEQV